jgi:hypothetical protein
MSEWEDLLENMEYEPVHHALQDGITLLEKYYRRADDTDAYFIAHGECCHVSLGVVTDALDDISLGSSSQTGIPQGHLGSRILRQRNGAIQGTSEYMIYVSNTCVIYCLVP